MGHDVHFLSRLARVAEGQVQLALSLYRDPELLKELFSTSALPDSAERVAISLADPKEGPFIVVTRAGHFVTCLGAGMRADNLPIITREHLDHEASRMQVLRDRLELARQVTGGGREPDMLPSWTKLLRETEMLSREDVAGLAAWTPILRPLFYEHLMKSQDMIDRDSIRLSRELGDRGARNKFTMLYGRLLLSHGPIMALLLGDPEGYASVFVNREAALPDAVPLLIAMAAQDLLIQSVACAINGVAHGGEPYITLIENFTQDNHDMESLRNPYLVSIGVANPNLRPPLEKLLAGDSWALQMLRQGPQMRETLVERLRQAVWPEMERTLPDIAARYGQAANLPEQLVLSKLVQNQTLLIEEKKISTFYRMMPLLAAMRPEDLFPPHEVVERWHWSQQELQTLAEWHIATMRKLAPEQVPVVAEKRPGRNDPCPCGSGKKFKKCCGAER